MPFDIVRLKSFTKQLEEIYVKFPRSCDGIEKELQSLSENPFKGDRYPGFSDFEVRKIRCSLEGYGIGKSGGLRLIILVVSMKGKVIPLVAYKKGEIKSEFKIKALIKDRLKEAVREIF